MAECLWPQRILDAQAWGHRIAMVFTPDLLPLQSILRDAGLAVGVRAGLAAAEQTVDAVGESPRTAAAPEVPVAAALPPAGAGRAPGAAGDHRAAAEASFHLIVSHMQPLQLSRPVIRIIAGDRWHRHP